MEELNLPLIKTVNGVRIYGDYYKHPRELERIISYDIANSPNLETVFVDTYQVTYMEDKEKQRKMFPGAFPSEKFDMSILQALWSKLYILSKQHRQDARLFSAITSIMLEIKRLGSFGYELTNPNPIFRDLLNEIREAYRQEGFQYFYGFSVNINNMFYRATRGDIPLRPDTFEAVTHLDHKSYKNIIKKLENGKSPYMVCVRTEQNYGMGVMTGWTKRQLIDAIEKSGLMKDFDKNTRKAENTKFHRGILYKDVGIKRKGAITLRYYAHNCYLQAIYRKLYNTGDYINWPFLCGHSLIEFHTLRHIATRDFGLDYNKIKKMSYDEICGEITKIANERYDLVRKTSRALATEATDVSRDIILQPYSPWIRTPTRYQFKEGIKIDDPYEQYVKIKEYCENEQTTKENLKELVTNMGVRHELPSDLTPYDKGAICEYLLQLHLPKAEKYEAIAFDCANPAITKRTILNTAMIMGLGNIIPKDVTQLSKEDLCNIINNYINVLREAKEFKLGEMKTPRKVIKRLIK